MRPLIQPVPKHLADLEHQSSRWVPAVPQLRWLRAFPTVQSDLPDPLGQ